MSSRLLPFSVFAAGGLVFCLTPSLPGSGETDPSSNAATGDAIRKIGLAPFASSPDLTGTAAERTGRVARNVLCLFGSDPSETEDHPLYPEDTLTAVLLQTALEWLGYEVDYHDVSEGIPKMPSMEPYCGVILDEKMDIPTGLEHAFLDWLLEQKRAGRKLVFLGNYGFDGAQDRARLLRALGIRGDSSANLLAAAPRIAEMDRNVVAQTIPVRPVSSGFCDLTAPRGSRVFLALEQNALGQGRNSRFDVIYAADWGGVILSPYAICIASESVSVPYIDAFAFLGHIFPAGAFPAPDVTTRDGLRIFYSHIDGDGFSSLSSVSPGKTCAEVLYDEVLKEVPWPITVSVVEAEIRGQMREQKPGDRDRLEEMARKIFRLPQVEPASHSYSHPFVWDLRDASNLPFYPAVYLPLRPEAGYAALDVRREIAGSLDYIRENLLGSPDPVRLILWSGNCRPSQEALRVAREAGVENLNGGKTVLCKRFPGAAGVAPKGLFQNGLMQVYASNQNEFYYTNGWRGPYHSGFSQVTETYEMTDSGRRLKPVNLYYHFYSADRPAGLQALQEIYRWCRARPMRALTAWEYSKLVRDSHDTEIHRLGSSGWEFRNRGEHTVYRLPGGSGYPDLEKSAGVTGFNEVQGQIYVQTDGSPRVRLFLQAERPQVPYLKTSTAAVGFQRQGKDVALEGGKRAAEVEIGGLPSGRRILLSREGHWVPMTLDADGVLRVTVPPGVRYAISQKQG